jgi:hypothetical protein
MQSNRLVAITEYFPVLPLGRELYASTSHNRYPHAFDPPAPCTERKERGTPRGVSTESVTGEQAVRGRWCPLVEHRDEWGSLHKFAVPTFTKA